jgi:hypothetical protein
MQQTNGVRVRHEPAARRLQVQIEKMQLCKNGTTVHVEGEGRVVVEPLCKWHLTSDDMLSFVASVDLPPGISQTLRAWALRAPTSTVKGAEP